LIKVYFDGASAGDPGPSGMGIFINHDSGEVEEYTYSLEPMSNHEAEMYALVKALQICVENEYKIVSFHTDSQLVEQSVEKRYAKNKKFSSLLDQALLLIDQFDLFFIKWIPSKQNKNADMLARKAIKRNMQDV